MSETESPYNDPTSEDNEDPGFPVKWKLGIGFIVVLAALGYFSFMAFQSATVYYFTVSEMNDEGPTPLGRVVRVSGNLLPSTFQRDEGSTVAKFALTDGSQTIEAAHSGILPALFFNEHSEIILEGTHSPGGVFQSQNVIVKCPSKYIATEEEEG